MRKYLTLFFLIPPAILSQSTSFDFHSPENIKKFADHLFCEGDYLRAIEQYNCADNQFDRDTIKFKIMLGYSELNLYQYSNEIFNQISTQSKFYPDAYLLSLKNKLLAETKPLLFANNLLFESEYMVAINKLTNISMLFDETINTPKEDFISPFDEDERNAVASFYDFKVDPHYKSPALAGVMSAIIPGSGKMYVGEWGDGITALLATGLFAFLAYDNFQAGHTTRAWIFTGLGAFFYAGNIYGSIAAAQIFNAKVDFDFSKGLNFFLVEKNYFVPEYEFCN